MGFDNECILNIQSLAGEYFCPVCRLLVYPNEALQSLCTHLYCKSCLTYVVNTTRACPYDGYLVTEADSKPLIESNKSLAESLGKIGVHCLFHRSGCTWQGTLSDCTSHCSGCAFGNSPVLCNRCGIQIMHRQVQEHAQSCPGVQPQAQAGSSAAATADQAQSAAPAAAVTSQLQASQSAAVAAPGKDLNQQSISGSQAQAIVQASVPTAEQWYQQQQQYQQFYQQFPGYDQYQQYYAQQQQNSLAHASNAAGQLQPQGYTQPQPQLQPQPQSQPQGSLVQALAPTQPQNQALVNSQQQVQPQTHPPPANGHSQPQPQPQPQPYTQPQLHPQPVQYQQVHPQPHIQQQMQTQVQPHLLQSQPHWFSQAQTLGQLQPRPQPNKPLNASILSQTQSLQATNVVTGHHSYPQPKTEAPMQTGVPQRHPIQLQSQFPQQTLVARPPLSHATVPSQQQLSLLPSQIQVQNIPSAQQPVQQPHFQQPGQTIHQRPVVQPVQQKFPQHHLQQQLPMPSQLRPQGQSHLLPSQLSQSVASSHVMQHAKSPNPGGRPSMPSQEVPSQPYSQQANSVIRPMYAGINQQVANQSNMVKTSNQIQLPSEQSGANSKPNLPAKSGATDADAKPFLVAHTGAGMEIEKTEGERETTLMHSSDAITVGKKGVLNEGPESIKQLLPTIEDKKTLDGSQQNNPPAQALEHHKGQVGNVGNDAFSSSDKGSQGAATHSAQIHATTAQSIVATRTASGDELKSYQHGVQDISNPHVAGVREHRVFVQTSQGQAGGFVEPSYPIHDQGMQPLPSHYRPLLPQRPGAPPLGPPHRIPGLAPPETHLGPQVLGPAFHPPGSILKPSAPNQHGPAQQSSELQPVVPQGPYNPAHSGALPPAFDSHGGVMARETSHVPDMFPNQRPNYMEGRRLHPNFPGGSLEHGQPPEPPVMHPSMKRMSGGLGDGRLHFQDERFNSFPTDQSHHVLDRAEYDDLKKFPRPFDRGPHGLMYDNISRMESRVGSIPSRFLPPYDGGSSNYPGERKGGFHEDSFVRMKPTTNDLEFFRPGPSFGRRHMDSFGSRSPGIYSHGFGGPGSDDLHGRELRLFGEPFADSRFSILPSHLRRGEFEGPGNMGLGNRPRNDFIGQDSFSSHLRWEEHRGNLHGHLRSREPDGFGAHSRHMREIVGPGSLDLREGGRSSFPHIGEPGFRSSYSLHGEIFTEELAFDRSKKIKQNMGWCRICKVDCETVEGLELHSQTSEHQKMAMDIVIAIKQNAKNKKLNSGNQSSLEDASKSKSGGSVDLGKKD